MTSGLFANQRETNLASTTALLESALAEISGATSEPGSARDLPGWRIAKGSAITRVTLLEAADLFQLRVCAIVMTIDAAVDRAALFGHLLTLNASLHGAAFALDGDQILLVSQRSTLDLDRSEILDTLHRVTAAADEHDDDLVARFGGRLGAT